jgi:ribosomal protein S4E
MGDNHNVVSITTSLEDKYLTMIDIESQEVTTTISMESGIISMAVNGRAIRSHHCLQ